MILSVPDGPAQTTRDAPRPIGGTVRRERTCPECGSVYLAATYNQLFCSPAHKRTYNKRTERRGLVLLPIAMTARQTRNGTRGDKDTGRWASAEQHRLVQAWSDEDKAAGRMSATAYLAARKRLGLTA